MFVAQEQALRIKYITDYHIDKTAESPLWRLCDGEGARV